MYSKPPWQGYQPFVSDYGYANFQYPSMMPYYPTNYGYGIQPPYGSYSGFGQQPHYGQGNMPYYHGQGNMPYYPQQMGAPFIQEGQPCGRCGEPTQMTSSPSIMPPNPIHTHQETEDFTQVWESPESPQSPWIRAYQQLEKKE
ncbi:hypothetical protein IC620_01130 [Hazenella sp. IB182357]|uniref:Uncharacterized protein n=1 Tax=Polycladospora coralii TaxID=2771432 RepID=A0A926RSD0_9BACL|nr:hypothetical protein [Polycladospora coralii]MBD1370965.1 hypothetical protein [Polycladospora coralii]